MKSPLKSGSLGGPGRIVLIAFLVYVLWVVVTYLSEGRILTLLRPGAVLDRMIYTVASNIIIGTILGLWVVRKAAEGKILSLDSAGFRPPGRTIIAVVLAGILGFVLLLLLKPVSLNPIILVNVYAQVFTVTIAEITICWAAIGSSVEGFFSGRGRIPALTGGIVAASLLFGVYHIAHSPPFNRAGNDRVPYPDRDSDEPRVFYRTGHLCHHGISYLFRKPRSHAVAERIGCIIDVYRSAAPDHWHGLSLSPGIHLR